MYTFSYWKNSPVTHHDYSITFLTQCVSEPCKERAMTQRSIGTVFAPCKRRAKGGLARFLLGTILALPLGMTYALAIPMPKKRYFNAMRRSIFLAIVPALLYRRTMNKAQTKKLAQGLVIKLSSPSKMPGYTMALPASACITGQKLRKVCGSVCSKCYACKGRYLFGPAKAVREHNLDTVRQGDGWVSDLVRFLQESGQPEFRFHDSGDLQSLCHLEGIVKVANSVPSCKFWLPTKEYGIVNAYRKAHPEGFPSNLCVRVSMPMIGQASKSYAGLPTSTVNCEGGFNCPVKSGQEGCDTYNCRACWDSSVANVNYHKH